MQTAEVIEIYIEIIDHAVAIAIVKGLHVAVHGFGGGFQLVGGAFVPIALSRPDALELGLKLRVSPANQGEDVVMVHAADQVVLVLLGQFLKVLVDLAGGFLHVHVELLAHGSVGGADAELVGGELLLNELADELGNLFQTAPGFVVASLPAVGGVELAAGALGGFGGGGLGGAVIGQLEDGEHRVILGVDGLHGLGVAAVVGVVQHGETAEFFFQFAQGGAGGEVFHVGFLL